MSEQTSNKLIGEVTQAQIASWKKEHGDVYAIKVEGHIAYFKKPNRQVMAFAGTKIDKSPIAYIETVLENTFIGGSREVIESDDFFFAAMGVAEQLIEFKTAELLKL